jgi:phenylalanyl-tRNA synthetase beta chain
MLYSTDLLKQFFGNSRGAADVQLDPAMLMRELTVASVEVEGFEQAFPLLAGETGDKIVLARITEVAPHPDADRLKVCTVFDGAREYTIVCGGSNVAPKMLIALAHVGAAVQWHGEGESIVLTPAKIRGVASEGMICAAEEIDLGALYPKTDEKEVLDLTPLFTDSSVDELLGKPLVEILNLKDRFVLDIDNKSMTHRSDLFSHAGMAQEIAATITTQQFALKFPLLKRIPQAPETVKVTVDDSVACQRYMALEISVNAKKPTPAFITQRLAECGIKSVNVIVDIGNYTMLEYGQPMHAFDAKQIHNNAIQVRFARAGESLELLGGQTKQLSPQTLVIADDEKVLAVAGVMGGQHSGISTDTDRIILEIAAFDGLIVRKGSQQIGVRTDSSLRYEKGLPEELVTIGSQRAFELLEDYADAKLIGMTSVNHATDDKKEIVISVDAITRMTGLVLTAKEVKALLARLQCKVATSMLQSRELRVTPPWFRRDLNIPEDLVEEIVRLYGIQNIPVKPLVADVTIPKSEVEYVAARRIKDSLTALGLQEVLTYSFYGADLMKVMGYEQNGEHVEIKNPLSEDLRFLRVSLIPRMLEVMKRNDLSQCSQIFEIGHVYTPAVEARQIGIMVQDPEAVRIVRGIVEELLAQESVAFVSDKISATVDCPFWNVYQGKQALRYAVDNPKNGDGGMDVVIGTLGSVSPKVLQQMGISGTVAFATLSLPTVVKYGAREHKQLRVMSPYPAVDIDLSLLLSSETEWADVERVIRSHAGEQLKSLSVVDVYRGDRIDADKKSVTCRIVLQSQSETLEMKTIELWRESLMRDLHTEFGAVLRDK